MRYREQCVEARRRFSMREAEAINPMGSYESASLHVPVPLKNVRKDSA